MSAMAKKIDTGHRDLKIWMSIVQGTDLDASEAQIFNFFLISRDRN